MTNKETRRANLLALIGNQSLSDFAKEHDLNVSHLSQIKTRKRNIFFCACPPPPGGSSAHADALRLLHLARCYFFFLALNCVDSDGTRQKKPPHAEGGMKVTQ